MVRVGLIALLVGCGGGPAAEEECNKAFQFDAWTDLDGDGAGDPATKASVCTLGEGQVTNGDDCNDTDPDISPYAVELCDGVDQDCDGTPDDGLFGGTWYADLDGDGWGDPSSPITGCTQPAGSSTDDTDCNDGKADAYPGAKEVCDGYDNNCDTLVDDDDPLVDVSTGTFFYVDSDLDGFGDDASGHQSCANPNPAALTDVGGDCDDHNADKNPDTPEVCDTLDNNCDGLVDEDDPLLDTSTETTFYEDLDDDGVGNSNVQILACFEGDNAATVGGDCNDNEPLIQGPGNWVYDNDGDGVGAGAVVGAPSCTSPAPGTVPQGPEDDCNDGNAAIYPGAVEICGDGIDSDCDSRECSDYVEDFEAGPPLPVDLSTSGNANWFVTGAKAHSGSYSAVNGNINNNENSNLTIQLDFPTGGSISFWHTGDSESGFDYLYFSIDGATLLSQSGFWGWTYANFNVAPGLHSIKWQYQKDSSVSIGADSVWIDDIDAIGGSP